MVLRWQMLMAHGTLLVVGRELVRLRSRGVVVDDQDRGMAHVSEVQKPCTEQGAPRTQGAKPDRRVLSRQRLASSADSLSGPGAVDSRRYASKKVKKSTIDAQAKANGEKSFHMEKDGVTP